MSRSREQLLEALATQRRHMAASCTAYDAGDHSEALRLATCVYNLVHDGGHIRSIMSQLGIKDARTFVATNVKDGAKVAAIANRYTPLVELERVFSIPPRFVPLVTYFQNRNAYFPVRDLTFDVWWNRDIIFFDGALRLTRRQLVFVLRNQEGGSHYDSEVRNPNFHPLKNPVIMFSPGLGIGEMRHLELASMRQVAEELELSFVKYERERHPNIAIMSLDELEEKLRKRG